MRHDSAGMINRKQVSLSISEARRIALRAQGLADDEAPFGLGKVGALRAIEHLGYVQIDTISVVQRAHHHVFWARVPDYVPAIVHDLQEKDRLVFEYWNHAASYLPMCDYRFSLPMMRRSMRQMHWADDTPELRRAMRRIYDRICREGALRLRDVESKEVVRGWTKGAVSKIEKRALHELWMRGKVMIRSRQGFQKVFDLAERVLPPDIDCTLPSAREFAEFHVRRGLRALGVARPSELHYLQGAAHASAVKVALRNLVRRGESIEVRIGDSLFYAMPDALNFTQTFRKSVVRVLSPFDNLVIQRQRLRLLFDFDYFIECYVPAAKRRFGYFCLPILQGERFIGQMDAKADRPSRTLTIHHLFLEGGFADYSDLKLALESFARFQDCDQFVVSNATPVHAKRLLQQGS